jgi:thiosulfate/3-mercaptopyruvate sulfurtransferase
VLPLLEVPEGSLITADWLERHLEHPNVRVVDVRGRHPSSALPHAKLAEYEAEHIPGATFVDCERDFIDVSDPVPVQVASA